LAGIGGHLATAAERVHDLDWRFLVAALTLQLATLACRAGAWRNVLAAAYPQQRLRSSPSDARMRPGWP